MANRFQLPGAENFSQYLEERFNGELTSEGPEIMDRSYNGEYGKRWAVKLNGNKIGEYFTFGPKPGETEFGMEFRGRIPGYVNETVVIGNKYKSESERVPEDTVSLIYANQRFEEQDAHKGPGRIVDTPWQRQDGHESIVFP